LAIGTVFDFRFAESLGCRPSAISASDLALQFILVFMRTPMHFGKRCAAAAFCAGSVFFGAASAVL
jgi:hypothetical protein